MKRRESIFTESAAQDVIEQLKQDIAGDKSIETLALLAKALPLANPGTMLQKDITESIISVTRHAAKVGPVDTLEALSKSVLWVGTDYISQFARMILLLQKPAIDANPNRALVAIERSLLVCYSAILPKNIHGMVGKCGDECLEWQRQTFFSIIEAIRTKPFIDPAISESILKIAEAMTDRNPWLKDINTTVKFLAHHQPEDSAWH